MTNNETKDTAPHTPIRATLTVTQLVATGLAAVTAAFLGSFIGTTGTVVGAGLASVVTSVSTTVYQRYLDRTRTRVRTTVSQVRRVRPVTPSQQQRQPPVEEMVRFTGELPALDTPTQPLAPADRPPAPARRIRWPIVAAVTALMFLLGIGTVTGVELLKGGPISGGDNGTSVGHLFGQPTERATTGDTPAPDTGSRPTSTTTPTPTPTTTRTPDTTTPTVGQAPPPPTDAAPTTTQPPATTEQPTEQPPSNPSLPAQPG